MLDGVEPYIVWIVIGLVLATLELVVPGVYLIWLAVAALITGGLAFIYDVGLALQVVEFVALALISVYSARRILSDSPIVSSDPLLNKPTGRMVGQTAVVTQAIEGGSGRVRYADGEWMARGVDMEPGERVRITGTEGSVLLVEPVNLITQGDAPQV
ncbi:NfeD family protein [Erythrobacter sp. 3-20A1M]|uniref:NfeD family protein n=1 Tax=Erythrobacter sp. 3-20A1M TaxID=2653850 RepID=UPI001BFCCDA9|nr:NfeD family protein [Erythrobacter sp. 3-20A1M]QWC57250.1 NfeD family protein [Erythrobacter sp. 3-20A1M]